MLRRVEGVREGGACQEGEEEGLGLLELADVERQVFVVALILELLLMEGVA